MDLTPRSHAALSPHFCSTTGRAMGVNVPSVSSPYPTPPQSRAQTEILPAHSPIAAGLGIFETTSISMCSPPQSLLQPSHGWQRGCVPNHPFSPMGVMLGLPQFEESHLALQDNQQHSGVPMLYSSPQHRGMASNDMIQRYATAYNDNLHYQSVHAMRRGGHSAIPQHRQSLADCSLPQSLDHNASIALFDLESNVENQSVENHNIERPAINNRVPRAPLRSSRSHVAVSQSDQVKDQSGGIRKQLKRKTTTTTDGKFRCEECGRNFARNSNCKSHMKTHDPNRKLPFKCTAPQCTKKFGRKTDLARHVDSVHKKLRQHGCDQCGRRFARQDTLRRHCEDGCRINRQAQRVVETLPIVSEHVEPYQSPPLLYPTNQTTSYSEADEQQKLHESFISPYLDNTANAFQQYL
ncbi:hypothetical protein ACJ72_02913 [Emergomyces africanus]|uniref:C2H2-type domain-containing protein n=1 Tax=Emergomyces africanus TaxID=1955775 RepID=A0A1B7P132_9EURO|nr:hypothetical protein ACJ72_02913 [Emergomyces africanus]